MEPLVNREIADFYGLNGVSECVQLNLHHIGLTINILEEHTRTTEGERTGGTLVPYLCPSLHLLIALGLRVLCATLIVAHGHPPRVGEFQILLTLATVAGINCAGHVGPGVLTDYHTAMTGDGSVKDVGDWWSLVREEIEIYEVNQYWEEDDKRHEEFLENTLGHSMRIFY